MSLVRAIAELHGDEIHLADSSPGLQAEWIMPKDRIAKSGFSRDRDRLKACGQETAGEGYPRRVESGWMISD